MISSPSYVYETQTTSQCVISSQGNRYGGVGNALSHSTEDNLYNSVFSKLAYHKSIEEVSNLIRIYNNSPNSNHDALFSILTQEKYRELASELYNLKIKKQRANYYEKGYEKIRINIILSFESLLYSMYQTKMAAANKRAYEGFKKDSDTLHDTEKLRSFIENLSITSHILPEVVVSAPLMKIKPEYTLYMKKYGVPANGIWKPDLLAEMVNQVKKMNPNRMSVDDQQRVSTVTTDVNDRQNERISMLRSIDDHPDGMAKTKENKNYVMKIPEKENGVVSSSSGPGKVPERLPSPRRRTRAERKRNPLYQEPIKSSSTNIPRDSVSLSVKVTVTVPDESKKEILPETPEIKENPEKKEAKKVEDSDYIPWEQWEMIPLAYWNALLK